MRSRFTRRIPLPVGVVLALAVLAFGSLAVAGLRSLAGTASATPGAPTPVGHEWSQVENHGTSGDPITTYWLGTPGTQALELKVNNARALRLEPTGGSPNVIGGYSGNGVDAGVVGATIGGGGAAPGFLLGPNLVTDNFGTISGGDLNQAGDNDGNDGDASWATVGGGLANRASGQGAAIAGGVGNTASGMQSFVGGGNSNTAAGDHSFASGRKAKIAADHYGSFMFADQSEFDFNSAAANEFAVRSTGGARVVTAVDGSGNPSAGVKLDSGDTAWEVLSDRAAKENFVTVDPQFVLSRLSEVPITQWNYKAQDASIRHIGPTAQDFYAAFGLSNDELYISPIDTDGVALAAIQGLYELSQEQSARVQSLEKENADLRQRLDGLEARVSALEDGAAPTVPVVGSSSSGLPSMWLLLGGGLALVLVGLVLAGRRLAGGRR